MRATSRLGALVLSVVAVIALGTNSALACASPRLAVTGYAEEGTEPSAVRASASQLHTLGVDGVNIAASGASVPLPDAGALSLLRQARAQHLQAEFLIGNYSEALGDFDPQATHLLVNSAAHRRSVIATLVQAVRQQGWNGIQVDLESIRADDRVGLVMFLRELRAALPRSASLSMAITAYTDEKDFIANGYDLTALGRVLDRVALMAYDEHGPTWNGVGPIGGLPWQRAALAVVLRHIPAAKLDLGVAGYGYTWPAKGTGDQVSDAQARAMVKADRSTARWDSAQGEWTAVLHDGTVLWWSDARSWRLRVELASRLHLHGMALWSLGLSDPLSRSRLTGAS